MTALMPVWGAFLDDLRARLLLRPALAGVTVATGPLGDDAGLESVIFGPVEDDTEWGLIGNYRVDSRFTCTGFILITQPGAGEGAIRAARERSLAIYGEVLDTLRGMAVDPSAPARAAMVSHTRVDQRIWGDGERTCDILFRIQAQAELEAV